MHNKKDIGKPPVSSFGEAGGFNLETSGKKVIILGLGNILLRDEGIGVRAVEALMENYDIPSSVKVIDGGTMGLDLLPFIEGVEKMLIVDAVNIKEKQGTITIIEDGDIPSFISTKLSTHQISFPDVVSALKLMGISPEKMTLIGIQPESIEPGLSMSESMTGNLEILLEAIIEKLRDWKIECKRKQPD